MLIPTIDVSQFLNINLFSISELKQATQRSVEMVTYEIHRKIQELVGNELKSTREEYLRHLTVNVSEFKGLITLTDALPLMVENGISPFDMKIGFANSPKAKRKEQNLKDFREGKKIQPADQGWYLTIPFRKGTPGTLSENFAGSFDKNIHKIVKNRLPILTDVSGSKRGKGLSLQDLENLDKTLGTKYSEKMTRQGYGEFGAYTHKAPIMQGLGKIEKQYGKTVQSQYMTFRRVSSNSDPNSWIHKGMIAKNFFDRAMSDIDVDGLTQVAIIDVLGDLIK